MAALIEDVEITGMNEEHVLSKYLEEISCSSSNYTAQRRLLQFIQKQHIRKPNLVLEHGGHLLKHASSWLGDDVWNVHEQVFIAALDLGADKTAADSLIALRSKFPESLRSKRLLGMAAERKGEYERAVNLYNDILKQDPVHTGAWKRKIAVLKAQPGKQEETVMELNKYLATFTEDHNAWMELCELYIAQSKFKLAKFAAEELILLKPENHAIYSLYAEIVFTIGGNENIDLARQYYAQSLELKPEQNLRAAYGLALCIRVRGSTKPHHGHLFQVARNKIRNEPTDSVVKNVVDSYFSKEYMILTTGPKGSQSQVSSSSSSSFNNSASFSESCESDNQSQITALTPESAIDEID